MLVAATAGCGVRLDTPPPEPPTPDAAEQVRQEAALAAATLAAPRRSSAARGADGADGATGAADEAGAADENPGAAGADDAPAAALLEIADDARAQEAALGGVWVAWPDGAPEGVATPPVRTAPPVADPMPSDVLTLLLDGAETAREAALSVGGDDVAAVLAAVALARQDDAVDLAAALGTEAGGVPAGEPLTVEALRRRGADGPTVRVLDQARYALETMAARTGGADRERAIARVAQLQALVDAALAAGAPDDRLPAYALDAPPEGTGLDPLAAAAAGAERRLVEHWVFSLTLVGAEERPALVAAAEDAAAQVRAWGGSLPALPGVA
ncbi:hypothetical protein MF406_06735 [Georgenia sp. TF02-10]|uniref:hypothetical protein n=1 Tax=Georgenia sp. TF02-10 TaxID=2917725 RepID=UPI001FA70EAB|nr:hypothetical protein [Georgenia sp. TF02-10]UNX55917.1 hypothetical protein MF406_06735 [Georgenia sp. TF02-10]